MGVVNGTVTGTSTTARQAVFAPLDGGDRVEAVIDRLAGALAIGLIADGEQLPGESELAASLGVATVTLREALSQLRNLGMIETRRGRGGGSFASRQRNLGESRLRKRLKGLGAHELRDLGDLQLAIGGMAAVRAAQRADSQHVAHLEDLVSALETAESPSERRRADGRFHVELAAAAQSVRLATLEMKLQAESGDFLWIQSLHDQGQQDAFLEKVVKEHRAIVKAVQAGNSKQARTLAERHVEDGVERLLDLHFLLHED
jgi:DNA-binding FadR family transcriptional regulator